MCDSVSSTKNFVSQYYSGTERVLGRVKWFNSKTGFGFISLLGENSQDIFVHHSELQVIDEQYRYLTQGEYVEFVLGRPEDTSKYEVVAKSVSGPLKGMLMCETRRIMRMASLNRGDADTDAGDDGFEPTKTTRSVRGTGPRQARSALGGSGKRPSVPRNTQSSSSA
jgi:cold shock CspA family protein